MGVLLEAFNEPVRFLVSQDHRTACLRIVHIPTRARSLAAASGSFADIRGPGWARFSDLAEAQQAVSRARPSTEFRRA